MARPRLTLPQQLNVAFRIAILVHPQLSAGERVQRVDRVLGSRQIHDAVHDERRGLELLVVPSLEQPLHAQISGVLGGDLIQLAEAPALVVSRVHQPVAWLLVGIEEPLIGHRNSGWALAAQRPRRGQHQHRASHHADSRSLHGAPLSECRYAITSSSVFWLIDAYAGMSDGLS